MTNPPTWRDLGPNHRFTGFKCGTCGTVSYPKRRRICPACRKTPATFHEVPLSPQGTLVSYVVQHYLPSRLEAPMPMGVVDLEGGGRVYGMMTDCRPEELRVGMAVEAVWRRIVEDDGEELYGFKFRPVRGAK